MRFFTHSTKISFDSALDIYQIASSNSGLLDLYSLQEASELALKSVYAHFPVWEIREVFPSDRV